jgi:hypothetical protein
MFVPFSVEVFDIFRNMSSDMDSEDKPFSFEIVKGFMETVTNLGVISEDSYITWIHAFERQE